MKRTLEPCGTRAAAARHIRRNEPLCNACKEAKNAYAKTLRSGKKPAREISLNKEQQAMDAALNEQTPIILWRKNNHGIWVHTYIDDPHPDSGHNGDKEACKRNHPFTEENTIIGAKGRECRTCKNERRTAPKPLTPEQRARKSELERLRRQQRREESPLLAAARTEI